MLIRLHVAERGEMPTREQVVAKAREYLKTPFCHQGRIKNQALDCVGLLLCVGEELGLQDKEGRPVFGSDHLDYPPKPAGNLVPDNCKRRLVEKNISDMKAGDIVLLRLARDPCTRC